MRQPKPLRQLFLNLLIALKNWLLWEIDRRVIARLEICWREWWYMRLPSIRRIKVMPKTQTNKMPNKPSSRMPAMPATRRQNMPAMPKQGQKHNPTGGSKKGK